MSFYMVRQAPTFLTYNVSGYKNLLNSLGVLIHPGRFYITHYFLVDANNGAKIYPASAVEIYRVDNCMP
jgi:hypothetical protein